MITEEQLLISKENRMRRQKEWIKKHETSIISYTLNIPGNIKQSQLYDRIHYVGYQELLSVLKPLESKRFVFPTGSEAIMSVCMDAVELKKITIKVESDHPLGRLFDIDVLDDKGQIINRELIKLPERRCLICNQNAKICVRSRTHSTEELVKKIVNLGTFIFT